LSVTDPKDDVAVKAKAEGILKRAQAGEDFAKLAKDFSQDPGSAAQGGDLGWSERKVWVPPFADAAFSMKEGEIRGLVKTQFGYHILKLEGIQPATAKTFEQVKSQLEADYRRNEADRLFNTAQDQLADAALQNTTDIEVAARKAGLSVHDIPNFSRTDGGGELGKAPAVLEAAFSQDVLDGHLSPMVEVDKGRGVVLRATDHKLPQQKPLEAVRTDIIAAWKKQRGAELAATAAADTVKRLTAGEAWDSVAKALGATPQPAKFVARADQAVPLEVRRQAFDEPKPTSGPVYAAVALGTGDSAVLALTAVREEPPAGDPNQQQRQMQMEFAQEAASAEARSYAAAARADAQVTVNLRAVD
jgi:peptidyl-prolyl cis-trans isomerase D